MFVTNTVSPDPRVEKEASTLIDAGHRVTIIAKYKSDERPGREATSYGAEIIRAFPDDLRIMDRVRRLGERPKSGTEAREDSHDLSPMWVRALQHPATAIRKALNTMTYIRVGKSVDADVYHAHDVDTLYAAEVCAKDARVPLVFDAHELAPYQDGLTRPQRLFAHLLLKGWLRRAEVVITVSLGIAEHLRSTYGIERPEVIKNVPEPFRGEPVDLRALFDIPDDHAIVIYQGGLGPSRGTNQLIAAMTHLDDVTLVLLGSDLRGLSTTYGDLASRLGVRKRVRLVPAVPRSELLAYTAGADVGVVTFLATSKNHELALPNKLFEYLVAGIPVLVSDLPEMANLISRTGAGLTCDPSDPSDIAANLQVLIENCTWYGSRAKAAAERFNWTVEGRRFLAAYAKAFRARPR